ncbi:hypothetical protein [Dyadobacter sp. NIV53]|uniref:hypothetical protein n=1 Tax=Dyadobacter sp. NIV53 TaxID=2861765 RepID=UPI001E4190D9|nr:hypothetical protein [Dyadobacter sp. NIV53]
MVFAGPLVCVMALASNPVYAQNILQVATKSIEKSVGNPVVRTLYIHAEKADIELVAWDKPEISIVLELSSKHPDKTIAVSDLNKFQYIAERNGKDYFLRNYILLKDGESKPVSNLKARYIIHLPAGCGVDMKNTFGSIILKGLTNNLSLKADFCTTTLVDIQGKGLLATTFGELKGKEISGAFSFESDHTNLRLEQISGAIKMDAVYGNVDIFPTTGLSSLTIKSKKAVITLLAKNWQQFNYDVNGAYTTMKLPNGFKWRKNTADFKEAFFKEPAGQRPD